MNKIVQNNRFIWLKSLMISLAIHALVGVLAFIFLEKSEDLFKKNGPQKVRLNFKRGGDSAIKDSKYKENTAIPQHATQQAQELLKNAVDLGDSSDSQMPQILTMPNDLSKAQNPRESNKGADSSAQSLNLSNLQIYDNASVNPNVREMKYKQALRYIAAQAIPSDQKREIIDLYGDELGDYGLAEIDFLVNNLRDIGRITQYHINRRGYPREAAILGQSGKNVIEFYLHPNGDISKLRVVSSSNSIILDNDMQTNIKVAFREYPRPTTKVKIRFFMTYTHTINPNDYR